MAKPIKGISVLKGKAAQWMDKYLKEARPDPEKKKRAKADREVARRIAQRR